jgi:hypothetical protein
VRTPSQTYIDPELLLDGFRLFLDTATVDGRRVKVLSIVDQRPGPGREEEMAASLENYARILREWFPLVPIEVTAMTVVIGARRP